MITSPTIRYYIAPIVAFYINFASCQQYVGAPNGVMGIPIINNGYFNEVQQLPNLGNSFEVTQVQQSVSDSPSSMPNQAIMTTADSEYQNINLINAGNVELVNNGFASRRPMSFRRYKAMSTGYRFPNSMQLAPGIYSTPGSVMNTGNVGIANTSPEAMGTNGILLLNSNGLSNRAYGFGRTVPEGNSIALGQTGGTFPAVTMGASGNLFTQFNNPANSLTNQQIPRRSVSPPFTIPNPGSLGPINVQIGSSANGVQAMGTGSQYPGSGIFSGSFVTENNHNINPYVGAGNIHKTTLLLNTAQSGMIKIEGLRGEDIPADDELNRDRIGGNRSGVKDRVSATLL